MASKFHIGNTMSLMSLRLCETVNPFIYSVGSRDLRHEIKKLFGISDRIIFISSPIVTSFVIQKLSSITPK